MCGIAGIIAEKNTINFENISIQISESFFHRGPDDNGHKIISLKNTNLSLIHRRLSIIDTSKLGHQPMCDENNGNWIIYNGEIYNFLEIKKELLSYGYVFKSETDTEVILKAYDKWGKKLLDKIEGMFAFSIWDNTKKALLIAVDPMGIKPLYWYKKNRIFCFASEIRPLIKSNLVEKELNKQSIDNYLAYGSIQGPETIINNVNILQGGNYLLVDCDGNVLEHARYWKADFRIKNNSKRDTIVNELKDQLKQITRQHLISDVPIGLFLSGGIDSTALAYFASNEIKDLNTFSVSFDEKRWAEGEYAKETAKLLKVNHTELILTSDKLKRLISSAVGALDQPSIDGTNVFIISKLVNERGIKVALSGQGGDEVFGGYSTFQNIPKGLQIESFLSFVPLNLRRLLSKIWSNTVDRKRKIPSKISQIFESRHDLLEFYLLLRQLMPIKTRRKVFPGDEFSKNAITLENTKYFKEEISNISTFDATSLLELNLYLGQTLLRDSDVMGMANSLEIRVPYLDRRIINFVSSIPSNLKSDPHRPKPLILDSAKSGVRDSIWKKPKQGFTFPWEEWLKNDLKHLGDMAFTDKKTWRAIGFDPLEVEKIWIYFLNNNKEVTWARVWAFIVLREWVTVNIFN